MYAQVSYAAAYRIHVMVDGVEVYYKLVTATHKLQDAALRSHYHKVDRNVDHVGTRNDLAGNIHVEGFHTVAMHPTIVYCCPMNHSALVHDQVCEVVSLVEHGMRQGNHSEVVVKSDPQAMIEIHTKYHNLHRTFLIEV